MQKIMFVCTGNICRSAMAESLLKKEIKERNLEIEVYSCGTYAQDGDLPTQEAIEVMEEYQINIKNHKATNIRSSNIEQMDLILCATMNHKDLVLNLYPKLKGKVYTMKEYVENYESGLNISDPWGYNIEAYRRCANELNEIVKKIIEKQLTK